MIIFIKIKTIFYIVKWSWISEFGHFCHLCIPSFQKIKKFPWNISKRWTKICGRKGSLLFSWNSICPSTNGWFKIWTTSKTPWMAGKKFQKHTSLAESKIYFFREHILQEIRQTLITISKLRFSLIWQLFTNQTKYNEVKLRL